MQNVQFNSIIHRIKYLYYLCSSPKGLGISTEVPFLGWSNPAFVFFIRYFLDIQQDFAFALNGGMCIRGKS